MLQVSGDVVLDGGGFREVEVFPHQVDKLSKILLGGMDFNAVSHTAKKLLGPTQERAKAKP